MSGDLFTRRAKPSVTLAEIDEVLVVALSAHVGHDVALDEKRWKLGSLTVALTCVSCDETLIEATL